jgi:hypothetical protein
VCNQGSFTCWVTESAWHTSLVLLLQVDQILLGYLQLDGSTAAVHGALACWATAAAVAGAADAMISSVIYAEAAAAGLKYTHVSTPTLQHSMS